MLSQASVFAQHNLKVIKINEHQASVATGTQSFVTGRVYIIKEKISEPIIAKITVKGTNLSTNTDIGGAYSMDISKLNKSKKKLVIICEAENYFVKEIIIEHPTNQNHANFELTPKTK